MPQLKHAVSAVSIYLATSLSFVASGGGAAAQSIPASGRYQCTGASGMVAGMNFTVGPGNIYTTPTGRRGIMSIHPGSGNVLFYGATPQDSYQGRYSPGPPPQVAFLTGKGGASSETGIICQVR